MASYNELIALIDAYINQNGVQAITGQVLNGVLRAMVDQLGRGYTIMGTAVPSTDPGTPDGPESWFASTPGTYTDMGGLTVANAELALLSYTPSDGWAKTTLTQGIVSTSASVNNQVGTPSVTSSYVDGVLTFTFENLKGNTGDPAGFGAVTASVDSNIGTPSVQVQTSGPDTAKAIAFQFHNLKGETGVTSVVATVDNTTGNPTCAVSLVGQELHLDFTGLKGVQGDTGVSADYPITIANNLTTNDPTSALSAAMGVQLESEISQLDLKVDGLDVNVGTWSVGSVNNPSGGHIPDYASNRRLRTAELTIPYSATYNLKVNSGYKFGLIVVAKRETLIWDSELTITLAQGDVYRIVLREDPDPTNTNIYSGWTQEQIDALVSASGFDMFVNSEFDELKEELEQEIEQEISNLDLLSVEDYSTAEVSDIWPRPKDYVTNGLVFFLDGKDFVAGQPWVDKIGSVSFAMTDAAKDGNGVRFNGTSARGVSTDTTDFPSQSYTIEMVVKLEKAVSASADSQVVFNSAKSGGFALGYGYQSSKKVFTNQAGTTKNNISYEFPGTGLHRYSVNKNVSVLNGNTLTRIATVGNWGVATSPVIGSTSSGSFYFKGVIYAIRVYNRLLTEDEMKQNQMFDLENYNL